MWGRSSKVGVFDPEATRKNEQGSKNEETSQKEREADRPGRTKRAAGAKLEKLKKKTAPAAGKSKNARNTQKHADIRKGPQTKSDEGNIPVSLPPEGDNTASQTMEEIFEERTRALATAFLARHREQKLAEAMDRIAANLLQLRYVRKQKMKGLRYKQLKKKFRVINASIGEEDDTEEDSDDDSVRNLGEGEQSPMDVDDEGVLPVTSSPHREASLPHGAESLPGEEEHDKLSVKAENRLELSQSTVDGQDQEPSNSKNDTRYPGDTNVDRDESAVGNTSLASASLHVDESRSTNAAKVVGTNFDHETSRSEDVLQRVTEADSPSTAVSKSIEDRSSGVSRASASYFHKSGLFSAKHEAGETKKEDRHAHYSAEYREADAVAVDYDPPSEKAHLAQSPTPSTNRISLEGSKELEQTAGLAAKCNRRAISPFGLPLWHVAAKVFRSCVLRNRFVQRAIERRTAETSIDQKALQLFDQDGFLFLRGHFNYSMYSQEEREQLVLARWVSSRRWDLLFIVLLLFLSIALLGICDNPPRYLVFINHLDSGGEMQPGLSQNGSSSIGSETKGSRSLLGILVDAFNLRLLDGPSNQQTGSEELGSVKTGNIIASLIAGCLLISIAVPTFGGHIAQKNVSRQVWRERFFHIKEWSVFFALATVAAGLRREDPEERDQALERLDLSLRQREEFFLVAGGQKHASYEVKREWLGYYELSVRLREEIKQERERLEHVPTPPHRVVTRYFAMMLTCVPLNAALWTCLYLSISAFSDTISTTSVISSMVVDLGLANTSTTPSASSSTLDSPTLQEVYDHATDASTLSLIYYLSSNVALRVICLFIFLPLLLCSVWIARRQWLDVGPALLRQEGPVLPVLGITKQKLWRKDVTLLCLYLAPALSVAFFALLCICVLGFSGETTSKISASVLNAENFEALSKGEEFGGCLWMVLMLPLLTCYATFAFHLRIQKGITGYIFAVVFFPLIWFLFSLASYLDTVSLAVLHSYTGYDASTLEVVTGQTSLLGTSVPLFLFDLGLLISWKLMPVLWAAEN